MTYVEIQAEPDFSGQITSPFYPSLMPPQCSCIWRFQVFKSIWLTFTPLTNIDEMSTDVMCCCPQTPHIALGVALKFQNYVLKLKDIAACEHGWWKVKEIM